MAASGKTDSSVMALGIRVATTTGACAVLRYKRDSMGAIAALICVSLRRQRLLMLCFALFAPLSNAITCAGVGTAHHALTPALFSSLASACLASVVRRASVGRRYLRPSIGLPLAAEGPPAHVAPPSVGDRTCARLERDGLRHLRGINRAAPHRQQRKVGWQRA